MEIEFLKMQGCGDDVIIVDAPRLPEGAHARLPATAQRMLDRSYGVGGNAVVVLGTSDDGLSVRCIGPDGDDEEIRCNALRCAARYASDSGMVPSADFSVTVAGRTQRVQIIDSANVRVDMGQPFSRETHALIRESARDSFTKSITVKGRALSYTPISLATPYAMFFVPDFSFPIRRTAREIASEPEFPVGTGIGFLKVFSRDEMRLRSWDEEGDDCACASAALVAAVVNGFTDREVFVHLKGGDVFLQWDETDDRIWLTGPAAYVFTGTFDDPDEPESPAEKDE